jgi:putative membrane protein
MLRLLASATLHLLANTVGLLIAAAILPGLTINALAFVTAVLIFTITEVVAGPLILKISLKNVPALTGGVALVTTLVGLIVTDIFSDGLSITGLNTWVLATLIVWLGALLAGLVLPLIIFKRTLQRHRAQS